MDGDVRSPALQRGVSRTVIRRPITLGAFMRRMTCNRKQDFGDVVAASYDATHCVKRSSTGAMRSASQWSSPRTDTARLSG